jgi:hypothetical protein
MQNMITGVIRNSNSLFQNIETDIHVVKGIGSILFLKNGLKKNLQKN